MDRTSWLSNNNYSKFQWNFFAVAIFSTEISASTVFSNAPGEDGNQCQLLGDPDIYGIGLRISYYLQWAAIVIALLFSPPLLKSAYTGANIVTFAISVSFYYSLNKAPNMIVAVDWNLFTLMTFGLFSTTIVPTLVYFYRIPEFWSVIGVAGLLWSPLLVGMPWVMFQGYDRGKREGCDFMLALGPSTNSIWSHGLRVTYRVFSILAVPLGAVAFGGGLYLLIKIARLSENDKKEKSDEIWEALKLQDTTPPFVAVLVAIVQIVTGSIIIATVERTISLNEIEMKGAGLTSTGQLIPVVAGLLNFTGICWQGMKSFTELWKQMRDDRQFRNRHGYREGLQFRGRSRYQGLSQP